MSRSSSADVVINEIMYNSSYAPDVEYIELYNSGPSEVNLQGWYLLDSNLTHPLCSLVGTLGVGEYLVVAADNAIFTAQFPGVTNYNINDFDPAGLGFGLGNGGDTVNLFDDDDDLHDYVAYDDSSPWPSSPDGSGPSLELINYILDNAVAASWDPSLSTGGTPGTINSTYASDSAPICNNGKRDIRLPASNETVSVTVTAFDQEGLISVELLVDLGSGYVAQPMYDDGTHGDGAAADSTFGALIPVQSDGTLVRYYARATDSIGQIDTWPGDAPVDYRAYTVGYERPLLVVNEIVASNATGISDEMGEFEDWIEIFNPGSTTIDLGGMFLSDNLSNRHMWEIPAGYSLSPGEYLTIWADNDESDGPLHTSFKLSSGGEEVGLFDKEDLGNSKIHGFKYGLVADDISIGFYPDLGTSRGSNFNFGYSPEYLATPTPGAGNTTSELYSAICINEFHTTSEAGGIDDWVELFNRGTSAVDISGMYISDNRNENLKYSIAPGTTLNPGSFIVFDEVELGFSFSSSGEVIMLSAADGISGLDFYDYSEQVADVSEGRLQDGGSRWGAMTTPTPGTANEAPTAVGEDLHDLAKAGIYSVSAVPNPFNPLTRIAFSLGQDQDVTVALYNVQGRLVRTLHRGSLIAGEHQLTWNGNDAHGHKLSSGTYFACIRSDSAVMVQKLLLLK